MTTGLVIAAIVAVGVVDVWLDHTDKRTISQWLNAALPRWADVVIVSAVVVVIGCVWGWGAALHDAGLISLGHVLLGHERYGKR